MSKIRELERMFSKTLEEEGLLQSGGSVYDLVGTSLWLYDWHGGLDKREVTGVSIKQVMKGIYKRNLTFELGSECLARRLDNKGWYGIRKVFPGHLGISDVLVRIEREASKSESR